MRMGIWKVDNVSKEEWERRMMRRHSIKQWALTILELAAMAGIIWMVIWLWEKLGI